MAAWTLETAQLHLNAWLDAEIAVTAGQSYTIGSRQLDRANLYQIREQIKFWRNEVEKLQAIGNGKGRNRTFRIVPRDL